MRAFQYLLFLFFLPVWLHAQNKLPDSERASGHSYIYTINRENLRKIHVQNKTIHEDMLGEYVGKYASGEKMPDLPSGNYMVVKAAGGKMIFSGYTVDDFYFSIVPSEEMRLCLYERQGDLIKDAVVKSGSKTILFNKTTQTYNKKKVKNEQVIEVNNKGVYHYLEIEKDQPYVYKYKGTIFQKAKLKYRNFRYKRRAKKQWTDKYKGFVVFNKPIYKPGETVKLKGYLTDRKGNPYTKETEINLNGYAVERVDTTLAYLQPYRPGMYEYEFRLSDSLNLKLDNYYTISLRDKKGKGIHHRFKYEEYELKSIRFTMSAGKEEFLYDEPVKLNFTVSDENDMSVYDGQIDLLVKPGALRESYMNGEKSVFIPDTLWRHTFYMDDIPGREIVLPDTIFPAGIFLPFEVEATYLSADNEKMVQTKKLKRNASPYGIDFSLVGGLLRIQELNKGIPEPIAAEIRIEGESGEVISIDSVMLPHSLPVPWFASDITVKTIHTADIYDLKEDVKGDLLLYRFYRSNDSIHLKVDNPAGIPFWYGVRRQNKEILKGHTDTRLDYSIKDTGKNGYSMQLTYLVGDEGKTINGTLPFVENEILMEVSTPTVVYPGQKTEVLVSITDKKGKPVSDVDITAYSFTSKFGNYTIPHVQVRQKVKQAAVYKDGKYEADGHTFPGREQPLNWDKWKQTMGLDTLEYYSFLYPDIYYHYMEPMADGSTQISPYVVINGVPQGVQMIWVNEKLHYYNKTDYGGAYTFAIAPGRHNLRFRTYDREVRVYNVSVERGMKNIFSFNAGKPSVRMQDEEHERPFYLESELLKKEQWGKLRTHERKDLASGLISIDNNFSRLELPGLGRSSVALPVSIRSHRTFYYLNPETRENYSYVLGGKVREPILTGPFPYRETRNGVPDIASVYVDNELLVNIGLEGGNKYTLYNNYQKLTQSGFSIGERAFRRSVQRVDFSKKLLTNPEDVRKQYELTFKETLSGISGQAETGTKYLPEDSFCRMTLYLGKDADGRVIRPSLIYIKPEKKEELSRYQLYYGGTRTFYSLPEGDLVLTLVFGDSTSYSKPVRLSPGGHTYVSIDSTGYEKNSLPAKEAFRFFAQNTKKVVTQNPYIEKIKAQATVLDKEDTYSEKNAEKGVVTGVVVDEYGELILGATVSIAGTTIATMTDLDGQFEITGKEGSEIQISSLGYETVTIPYKEGYDYYIVLEESSQNMDEVVVVGYGNVTRQSVTGAVTRSDLGMVSNVSGIMIRGTGTANNTGNPLIVINGVPFDGSIDDLDSSLFSSFSVLKDASATALYGARAANGVIVIEADGVLTKAVKEDAESPGLEISMEQGNSMRRNFHDDAFWQPRLKTDKKGEASFEVTYPDDITRWNASFIAIGNKKQASKKQLSIRSFKTLSAHLSTPRFAIRGDSVNLVGRITNHSGDSLIVEKSIHIGETTRKEELNISASYVDYIPVKALEGDSITVAYSLEMATGYFDGEERTFPVFEQGLLQIHGEFVMINDTSSHLFTMESSLGEVILHAEASSLDILLREIENVHRYPYLCNEQMASKIKALLAKRKIARVMEKEFKEDKNIRELISRLGKNRNQDGLWGWWNRDNTHFWISAHVLSALLDARDEGFDVQIDDIELSGKMERELKRGIAGIDLSFPERIPLAKQRLLDYLLFLERLKAPAPYIDYFRQIDAKLEDRTVSGKLKTMHAMSVIGLGNEISIDSLLKYSHTTMLGGLYWGTKEQRGFRGGYMDLLPYRNNMEQTLIAYNILKNRGGHETELKKIQTYFFECRRGGFWQNTFESSRIIEAILPDMMEGTTGYQEAAMFVNDRKVTEFPYTVKLSPDTPIQVKKEGTLPLFVTAYQQSWNKQPEAEAAKGMAVCSYFVTNKDTVSYLQAGKVTKLEVQVQMDATAEYVQIEVPVPAGCSYETKARGNYWKEIHREHFKEKVVIFCNKLTAGSHLFTVELIPRYTGHYTLNPAKAELMYFPTFYGNEEIKTVLIE